MVLVLVEGLFTRSFFETRRAIDYCSGAVDDDDNLADDVLGRSMIVDTSTVATPLTEREEVKGRTAGCVRGVILTVRKQTSISSMCSCAFWRCANHYDSVIHVCRDYQPCYRATGHQDPRGVVRRCMLCMMNECERWSDVVVKIQCKVRVVPQKPKKSFPFQCIALRSRSMIMRRRLPPPPLVGCWAVVSGQIEGSVT